MFRKSSKTLTTADEAYEYALSLLDRREHGEKELSQKLTRKGCTVPLISETLAKLKRFNLLNEERYARRVFELWRNKRIYGRLHLQAELAKKQVADTYISLFLQEFTDTEEEEHVLAACDMLCKRHDAKYDVTTEKGVAAFVRYLTARGFGTRMIRIALEKAKATLLE